MNAGSTPREIRAAIVRDQGSDVVVPRLIDLHLQGRFPFDRLVRFYDLDQINQAAEDAASGAAIKPILRIA